MIIDCSCGRKLMKYHGQKVCPDCYRNSLHCKCKSAKVNNVNYDFLHEMDNLQRELEENDSETFDILYKKLGRLPTCKELSDFEESLSLKGNDGK